MLRKHRTCDELGVCQRRPECRHFCFGECEPTTPQKAYPFAPGVIEGPATNAPSDGRAIEILAVVIALGSVLAVLGFASGYLGIPGWLL